MVQMQKEAQEINESPGLLFVVNSCDDLTAENISTHIHTHKLNWNKDILMLHAIIAILECIILGGLLGHWWTMGNMLTCLGRRRTCAIIKMNNGYIPFQCASSRTLLFQYACMHTVTWLSVTAVLFLEGQLKIALVTIRSKIITAIIKKREMCIVNLQ